MAKKREKIVHAAVKDVNGFVVVGKCHADCFYSGRNMGLLMSPKTEDQGFMTSHGRYVDREEAATIAKKAGQVKDGERAGGSGKLTYLISEDIWYQRERFEYNQTRGYFEVAK